MTCVNIIEEWMRVTADRYSSILVQTGSVKCVLSAILIAAAFNNNFLWVKLWVYCQSEPLKKMTRWDWDIVFTTRSGGAQKCPVSSLHCQEGTETMAKQLASGGRLYLTFKTLRIQNSRTLARVAIEHWVHESFFNRNSLGPGVLCHAVGSRANWQHCFSLV